MAFDESPSYQKFIQDFIKDDKEEESRIGREKGDEKVASEVGRGSDSHGNPLLGGGLEHPDTEGFQAGKMGQPPNVLDETLTFDLRVDSFAVDENVAARAAESQHPSSRSSVSPHYYDYENGHTAGNYNYVPQDEDVHGGLRGKATDNLQHEPEDHPVINLNEMDLEDLDNEIGSMMHQEDADQDDFYNHVNYNQDQIPIDHNHNYNQDNDDENQIDLTDAAVDSIVDLSSFNPFMMNSHINDDENNDYSNHLQQAERQQEEQEGVSFDINESELEELEQEHSHRIIHQQDIKNEYGYETHHETPAKFTRHHEPAFDLDQDNSTCSRSVTNPSTPLRTAVQLSSSSSHMEMISSLQRSLLKAHSNVHASQKESAVLKSLLAASTAKVQELEQVRKSMEKEQEVTLLKVKRDLLGEKEQLLLDLRHDFQIQVSKLSDEKELAISSVTKEKEDLQEKAASLQATVVTLNLDLEESHRALQNASVESEKLKIEQQGALNRCQMENESLKAELDSLRGRFELLQEQSQQSAQKSYDVDNLELKQARKELDAADRALAAEKSRTTQLIKENEMLMNSLKPPLVPSSFNEANKSFSHLDKESLNNSDTDMKIAEEYRVFLEQAIQHMSGVVDIPSQNPPSPALVLESLSLLVSHTLTQSSRISQLASQIPHSWTDLSSQYPHLVQGMQSVHKEQMSSIVAALKKEYLGRYDAALARVLEDAKKQSQQRIGVLEKEVLDLRKWRKSYFDADRNTAASIEGGRGGQVEIMGRSLQQRPSYYITSNASDQHQYQQSPLKQKYIETLKEMRDQVDRTTKSSLARLEVEWKKRGACLNREWKEGIMNALQSLPSNNSFCSCRQEITRWLQTK